MLVYKVACQGCLFCLVEAKRQSFETAQNIFACGIEIDIRRLGERKVSVKSLYAGVNEQRTAYLRIASRVGGAELETFEVFDSRRYSDKLRAVFD